MCCKLYYDGGSNSISLNIRNGLTIGYSWFIKTGMYETNLNVYYLHKEKICLSNKKYLFCCKNNYSIYIDIVFVECLCEL